MFNNKRSFELSPRLQFGIGKGNKKNQILKIGASTCFLIALLLSINTVRLLVKNNSVFTSVGAAEPQVLGATDTKSPDNAKNLEFIDYKIEKGDTLFNVSQKFNISWTTLATINNLKSPFALKLGQVLKVPKQ